MHVLLRVGMIGGCRQSRCQFTPATVFFSGDEIRLDKLVHVVLDRLVVEAEALSDDDSFCCQQKKDVMHKNKGRKVYFPPISHEIGYFFLERPHGQTDTHTPQIVFVIPGSAWNSFSFASHLSKSTPMLGSAW